MHKRWNADEIDRLSTHRERNEVIAGERFVQPPQSSTHQQAIIRLATWLLPYCDAMSLTLIIARAEVRFGEFDRVEPDLFVIPRAADGRRAGSFADVGRLLLVVEVVSPGTAIVDRVQKRELYRAHGVPEYWVVNLVDGQIEVHTSIVRGVYTRVVPFKKGERVRLQQFADVELDVTEVLP